MFRIGQIAGHVQTRSRTETLLQRVSTEDTVLHNGRVGMILFRIFIYFVLYFLVFRFRGF